MHEWKWCVSGRVKKKKKPLGWFLKAGWILTVLVTSPTVMGVCVCVCVWLWITVQEIWTFTHRTAAQSKWTRGEVRNSSRCFNVEICRNNNHLTQGGKQLYQCCSSSPTHQWCHNCNAANHHLPLWPINWFDLWCLKMFELMKLF